MNASCFKAPLVLALAAALGGCASVSDPMARVKHVVVIYAENRSFDNLYGLFPGANGVSNATPAQSTQRDHDGSALPELVLFDEHGKPDPKLPRLPNRPFRIDEPPIGLPLDAVTPDLAHAFYRQQEQIHGGRNDMFAAMSDRGGWTMGYYDGSALRLWGWAREFTLADNFFMGAFGGSYLNHQYLICACAPRFAQAPDSYRPVFDADGKLRKAPGSPSATVGAVKVRNPRVTPDGYSIHTAQPPFQPSGVPPAVAGPLTEADPRGDQWGLPLPVQHARTIGDTLSAKGISWAWYAAGWRAAVRDGERPPSEHRTVIYGEEPGSPNFQPHHQPFNYYARFAPGTADRERHLLDGEDFLRAIDAGALPAVSFYKPAGRNNQHPGYADLVTGDRHMDDILRKLRASPQWKDMLVIVTYDENGGYWDHVPPPSGPGWGDRFGPGSRIPALFIGPMVKRGYIDSTPYDTTSILKFITERFGLEPLAGVREKMGDLTNALQ